jgi:hypothetical protein
MENDKPVVVPELERCFRIVRLAFAPNATEQDRRQALHACVDLQAMVHAEMERDVFDLLLEKLMPFAPAGPAQPLAIPIVPVRK